MLAIATRRNKDIQGIIVGEEEIKLGLFADNLIAFWRNDKSLTVFLDLVENFGKCSGLIINHEKSEIIFLGNANSLLPNHTMFKDMKIKKSVKLLGVPFTYNYRLKRKLNFDELIKSIKGKLKVWRWRDLTIIGKIQIVKTFIIPIFLYRASLTSDLLRQRICK